MSMGRPVAVEGGLLSCTHASKAWQSHEHWVCPGGPGVACQFCIKGEDCMQLQQLGGARPVACASVGGCPDMQQSWSCNLRGRMVLGLPQVRCVPCSGAANTVEGQLWQLGSDTWQTCHWGWCLLSPKVISQLLGCGYYPAGKSTRGPRFGRAQSAKVPAHSEVVPTFPSGGQLPAVWCTQLCIF